MNKSHPIPSYDFSKYIDNDILNYALSNGIIDLDSVHESYMASNCKRLRNYTHTLLHRLPMAIIVGRHTLKDWMGKEN